MERLKIYGEDGAVLLDKDLSDEKGPLMILAGDTPRLAQTVSAGQDVLGALVRDEDGWFLASAKADIPVVSGAKHVQSCPLTAGVASALGHWAFRLDAEIASNGPVLIWRAGSAPVAVERLAQGKNSVVHAADGSFAVNPPVSGGEIFCEIFPTSDGGDIVSPGSTAQRLSVERNILFSVGTFQAMIMDAADASAALKSGNPFAWPARKTRAALLAGLTVIGLICVAALLVAGKTALVESAIAARTGAVETKRHHEQAQMEFSDEDVLVYDFSFLSSLPMILRAERSAVTRDLISRGRQLEGHIEGDNAESHERRIARVVRFLEDVDAIQAAVQKSDWEKLKATLAAADHDMFVYCDADAFYFDAEEVADFITVELPGFLSLVASGDSEGKKPVERLAEAEKRITAYFESLKDNIFMSGEVVRRERDAADARWSALSAYIPAREAFLSGEAADCNALIEVWASLVDVFDPDDPAFAPLIARERKTLTDAILKQAADASDISLIALCALGEAVGLEDERIGEWRRRAQAARKRIGARYRELYSDYRMKAAVAPAAKETLAVLDDMLALGLEDNPFHQWALREKARAAKPAKADKEESK